MKGEQKIEPGTGNQRLERNSRSLILHKLHGTVRKDTTKDKIIFWVLEKPNVKSKEKYWHVVILKCLLFI